MNLAMLPGDFNPVSAMSWRTEGDTVTMRLWVLLLISSSSCFSLGVSFGPSPTMHLL